MSSKYANCSFQKAITDFYSNRLALGLSLAVPFEGLIRASTTDLLYEDFRIHFPTKPRPSHPQACRIITNCASQAREGCSVRGPNKGELLARNSTSATYIAASNAISNQINNHRNDAKWNQITNAKWNPINNPRNSAKWNPITNAKWSEIRRLKIADENRIRLEEMLANGDIKDLPRCHEDLRLIVDSIVSKFDYILLLMSVYVGYTGVSLATEPFR